MDISPDRKIAKSLLRWYDLGHRKMPWRVDRPGKPNAYHVLVSEFMLQQTQVATVQEYFPRFLRAFPTLAALARAPRQKVLAQWQGLGYYRRAGNLHEAARQIVRRHGGRVPADVAALRELPGVGRYTAGAVASIAFGAAEAVVDGNVARVLARLGGMRGAIDSPAMRKRLWQRVGELLPGDRPGDFNQALMELGASVCVPRKPRCGICPLVGSCAGHAGGRAERLGAPARRGAARKVAHHVLVVERDGRYLLEKRAESGLWPGLWQFPTWEEPAATVRATQVREHFRRHLKVGISPPCRLGRFTHGTTHRRIEFTIWLAEAVGAGQAGPGRRWVKGLTRLPPMAKPQQRAVEIVRGQLSVVSSGDSQ